MRTVSYLTLAALSCGLALAAEVHAHPGPATPPEFLDTDCIKVVDTRTTMSLQLPYRVAFDDTAPEPDHITIADSKTYQFFAFRGALQSGEAGLELYPFAPGAMVPLALPEWFSRDDVMRSAAANTPMIAPDFRAENITEVLQDGKELAPHWVAITSVAQRVPITIAVSQRGFFWDLKGVTPGVYQLAGYVFSPPYNTWEPRPGVIKLISADSNVPAVTVESVDGILYSGQGRRITGCVDAPPGSKLDVMYSVEGPTMTWQPIASGLAATGPMFDVCFHSPDPQLAGFVHVRVEATAPDGTRTVAYAPDKLVLVATPASCSAGAATCCEPQGMQQPAAAGAQAVSAAGAAGAMPVAGAPAAAAPAGGAPGTMAIMPMLPAGMLAPPPPPTAATSSCSVQRAPRSGQFALAGYTLALFVWRKRRKR